MGSIYYTRNIYLRCMSTIYMFAFSSLYLQIRGLYGINGVMPAHTQLNLRDKRPLLDLLWEKPTLLYLGSYIGLNVCYTMELLGLIGIVFSFIGVVCQKICSSILFVALWLLYLSLYQVGQTFMWFQWDILLLETGFITIFVAPLWYTKSKSSSPKEELTFWLVKWLLFRLMFASGVVKLTSKCPVWWSLSALTVHYESQCIPTPVAWYLHFLPVWFHKLCVVATFVIEIFIPFLFFAPVRHLRLFSCYSQVLLQVMIIISGNYNFFNLLTLVLCISLLDDKHLRSKNSKQSTLSWIISCCIYILLGYVTIRYFGLRLKEDGKIHSEITFNFHQFTKALEIAVPITVAIGAGSLLLMIFSAIYVTLSSSKSRLHQLQTSLQLLIYSSITLLLFGISLVSYTTLDRVTHQSLPSALHTWNNNLNQFHLSGSYGLFRSMTGVGGRPELILEGSNQFEGPWIEIPFKYKPGDIHRNPPFIVPHQPRIDWQMWFAALGNYHHNPWLTSLAYRILTNETDVLNLLDPNIFEDFDNQLPPKYIKGSLYIYHYNEPYSSDRLQWWTRQRSSDYLPIFSATHQPLLDYLKNIRFIGYIDIKVTNEPLKNVLDFVWDYLQMFEPVTVIWGFLIASFVIVYSRAKLLY